MVLNSGKELGKTIASQSQRIDKLEQEISPNDPSASFPLFASEVVKPMVTVVGKKRINLTGTLILDHVTQSEINTSDYLMDLGYDTENPDDNVVIISETF